MSVKEYYYEHFNDLSPDKQFHFATRMKNFFKTQDFDEYLKQNKPSTDIMGVLFNNDYSMATNLNVRKSFFEKYPEIYGMEAALFRVHHLLKEYDEDIRGELTDAYPLEKLYDLSDNLFKDEEALRNLSSWAVNTICLTEELFPRNNNVTTKLAKWVLQSNFDALDASLTTYLCTHIVICESEFYTKDLKKSSRRDLMTEVLNKCASIIRKNIDTILLDPCIEYLVCRKMIDIPDTKLEKSINTICKDCMRNSPYLIDYRRDSTPKSYYHTLDGAEHVNALFIMSGLDKANSRKWAIVVLPSWPLERHRWQVEECG